MKSLKKSPVGVSTVAYRDSLLGLPAMHITRLPDLGNYRSQSSMDQWMLSNVRIKLTCY